MPEISVIICTHNPRPDYLGRTLDSLKAQTLPCGRWELLVIDNASQERVSAAWDLGWHPQARHVREEHLGLTAARLRGIREAQGELLVFVDDDNVLAPDFFEQLLVIEKRYPHVGTFGAGLLEPEFEVPPTAELAPCLPRLALRTVSQTVWSNNIQDTDHYPWGAGLCVRRSVTKYYVELLESLNTSRVLDRRGKELFSGGDDLFSCAAVGLGLGFGLFPELRLTHLISRGRLTQDYFLRLLRDSTFSGCVLDYLLFGTQPARRDWPEMARAVLRARKGLFAMRWRWAGLQGTARAARFITANNLSPLARAAKTFAP